MTTENQALNLVGNLTVTDLARGCYTTDTAYDRAVAGRIGEGIDPGAFDRAPQAQRDLIIANVRKVLETPTITPAQIHANWLELMKAQGWTRGATTNVDRKQHALLVPYTELTPADQIKSVLFIANVRGFMEPVGGKDGKAVGQSGLRTEP